jgi:hypothetical protein
LHVELAHAASRGDRLMRTCGTATLNSNEMCPRKAERSLASSSLTNFEASNEDDDCFRSTAGEHFFGCDRFDGCWRNDPADTSACKGSSASQKHLSAVTYMQCYNITFLLHSRLLRATEQGASQGSRSPTAPRRSFEKAGVFFSSSGGRRLFAKKSSHVQAMAGEIARAGELAK